MKPRRRTGKSTSASSAKGSSDRHTALVRACLDTLQLHRIEAVKTQSAKLTLIDPHTMQRRRFETGKKGWPDITGYLPERFGTLSGKALHVECKTGGGCLSPDQKAHREKAEKARAIYLVIRDDVTDLVGKLMELQAQGKETS